MAHHPNVELVRRVYAAIANHDLQLLVEQLSKDAVQIVPGDHQLSGAYRGHDEILGYYEKLSDFTEGSFWIEVESVEARGEDRVVARQRTLGQCRDKTLDMGETLTFTIVAGKIMQLEEKPDDQGAMDEFFS